MKYKTIKQRWKSNCPDFFRQLKKYAFIVGGSCIAMITIINSIHLVLPASVTTVLSYIIVLCVGIAGTSKLTKE